MQSSEEQSRQARHPAFLDQFSKERWIIFCLTISLVLVYTAFLLPFTMQVSKGFAHFHQNFCTSADNHKLLKCEPNDSWRMLVYSVPVISLYNIIECICFSGFMKYSYSTVMAFRGIFFWHDIGYFVPYTILASHDGGLYIGCSVMLVVALALNGTTMLYFLSLPRKSTHKVGPEQNVQLPDYEQEAVSQEVVQTSEVRGYLFFN